MSFSLNENMFVITNFLPKVCFLDLTQFEFSKNDEIKDRRPVLIFDRKLKPTSVLTNFATLPERTDAKV